ncbi:hypothetical protein G6L37_01225 [Agrobacterium rubi]|nr:hypothetical protein [Agrobacterium rubi]NTF24013.1 hypothetical protein [Agrobacterium rubi]
MSAAGVGSLKSLPVQTHPRFSVSVCIERLVQCLLKTERALDPPIWKKVFGGVSRDHARAVAAACKADARIVRTAIRDIIASLGFRAVSSSERNSGLRGYCEKVLGLVDEWRDLATRFEENEFQSDERLLHTTRTLLTICMAMRGARTELAA